MEKERIFVVLSLDGDSWEGLVAKGIKIGPVGASRSEVDADRIATNAQKELGSKTRKVIVDLES